MALAGTYVRGVSRDANVTQASQNDPSSDQHSPTDAWFSGTIDAVEGRNVRGNNQGAATFAMSVQDGDPNGAGDRVALTRGATPFECGRFHDAQRTVTSGNLVVRQR
jgi:hypothetical protein